MRSAHADLSAENFPEKNKIQQANAPLPAVLRPPKTISYNYLIKPPSPCRIQIQALAGLPPLLSAKNRMRTTPRWTPRRRKHGRFAPPHRSTRPLHSRALCVYPFRPRPAGEELNNDEQARGRRLSLAQQDLRTTLARLG